VIYSFIFLTLAALGVVFVPGLMFQASDFVTQLPDRIAALRPLVEQMEFRPLRELLLHAIGNAEPAVLLKLDQSGPTAEPAALLNAGGLVLHTLYSVVTVFLLAYYWLTERAAIKRAALRLAPDSRARQINATWVQVEARLGGWVRGQLLIMLALALMAGVCFVALGLPNPLLLAVLAGLCEMVPLIGPFLAFLPALLVALAFDPLKAALLLPLAVVIQQVEGNVLVPRIMSRTVGISPLTVILGILIGSILYGPAGAFLAVPVAAALQVVFDSTLRPDIEADTTTTPVPTSELEGDTSAPGVARTTSVRYGARAKPHVSRSRQPN
jgi:predicted PurR-regulated permease PerM